MPVITQFSEAEQVYQCANTACTRQPQVHAHLAISHQMFVVGNIEGLTLFQGQFCDRKHCGKQRDGLKGNPCVRGLVSTCFLLILLCATFQEGWPAIGYCLESMTAFQ